MRDEGLCGRETVERGLREAKVFGWLKRKKENGFGEGCRLCSGRLREKKKKKQSGGGWLCLAGAEGGEPGHRLEEKKNQGGGAGGCLFERRKKLSI